MSYFVNSWANVFFSIILFILWQLFKTNPPYFSHNNLTLVLNGCTHKEPHQSKDGEERGDEDEEDDEVAEGCVALKSESEKCESESQKCESEW